MLGAQMPSLAIHVTMGWLALAGIAFDANDHTVRHGHGTWHSS